MKLIKMMGVGAAVLVLQACAFGLAPTPEAQVTARAQASWQARMASKFEEAYKLAAPSFRKEVSFEDYRSSFGGATRWVSADVISVACDPQKCVAKMSISVPSPVPHQFSGNISTRLDEVWVLEDNQWWLMPKR